MSENDQNSLSLSSMSSSSFKYDDTSNSGLQVNFFNDSTSLCHFDFSVDQTNSGFEKAFQGAFSTGGETNTQTSESDTKEGSREEDVAKNLTDYYLTEEVNKFHSEQMISKKRERTFENAEKLGEIRNYPKKEVKEKEFTRPDDFVMRIKTSMYSSYIISPLKKFQDQIKCWNEKMDIMKKYLREYFEINTNKKDNSLLFQKSTKEILIHIFETKIPELIETIKYDIIQLESGNKNIYKKKKQDKLEKKSIKKILAEKRKLLKSLDYSHKLVDIEHFNWSIFCEQSLELLDLTYKEILEKYKKSKFFDNYMQKLIDEKKSMDYRKKFYNFLVKFDEWLVCPKLKKDFSNKDERSY